MNLLVEILAAGLILAGASITALAALGVARLPDPFMRMHAATKAGVVGSGLVLLGAAAALGGPGAWITALCGVAFLAVTTPIASHVLGRASYVAGAPLSPSAVQDALSGVIERRAFDPVPLRDTVLRTGNQVREEKAMSVIGERGTGPAAMIHPAAPKRVLCWLAGGTTQGGAIEVAMTLSQEAGARLVGISALDPDTGIRREAMPAGGASWARWLADEKRARMRDTASAAFRLFEEAARRRSVDVAGRHEEGDLDSLAAVIAAHDVVVVPAGIGASMFVVPPAEELASLLIRRTTTPVLRVRRHPPRIRSIVVVVCGTPACRNLAGGLIRSGLWPTLPVSLLPVPRHGSRDEEGRMLAEAVDEQAGLLRAHGRSVAVLEAIDPQDAGALESRVSGFDVAVMACLSRKAGPFGALSLDPFEVVAGIVPVTLLPSGWCGPT